MTDSFISLAHCFFNSDVWIYQVLVVSSLAVLLDQVFGEPKKLHPLILFGNCADFVEKKINRQSSVYPKIRGIVAWAILIVPPVGLFLLIDLFYLSSPFWDGLLLYFCIGCKSMKEHALAIYHPLMANNLEQARIKCGMIVSRDVEKLSELEIV